MLANISQLFLILMVFINSESKYLFIKGPTKIEANSIEYAIYSILLNNYINSDSIGVYKETTTDLKFINAANFGQEIQKQLSDSLKLNILISFKKINSEPSQLNPELFSLGKKRKIFFASKDIKYSQSIPKIEFSRIAFGENYAIVYMGENYDGLGGEGNYFILKVNNNIWQVISKIELWVR